ncbi:MAG: DPP IV N-terminal domain-containing protein, partial [Anaerolineae bacterium]|nr:DPP IV N-terminal domain-containing protein [Anaerolineae bacterium]
MTQSNITITDVAKYPRPGLAIPTAFAFSPDDTLITCLFSAQGDLSQQLYAYDPRTGERRLLATPPGGGDSEETLSLEEKLRRERRRQLALGITRYAWARERARLLIPLQDGVYVQDGAGAPLRKVLGTEDGPILDPQLSREGRHLAYVQDAELYVLALEDGTPRQLTTGARDTGKTHGLAEFVAQEEMHRYHGFWWSPDGAQLAFTEVDETHIPSYRIVHQGKETVIHEDHGYPFAGAENARVRLGIISSAGGAPLWLDLGEDAEYLARVAWFPDGALSVQVENRAQTRLQLLRFDSQTGARTRLLEERTDVWINLHTMWTPLKDGRFIWASERTGFMHLYLCDREGAVIRPLTEGDWVVDSVAGVDEENGIVYFTGTLTSPLERHLYAVPLDGGEIRKITRAPGTHQIVLDHGRERFIDIHSSLAHPPAVTLRATQDGRLLQTLYDEPDPRIAALAPEPPALVTLKSRDGVTLYGALYRP